MDLNNGCDYCDIENIHSLVERLLNCKSTGDISQEDFQEIILTLGGAIADKKELSEKRSLLDAMHKTIAKALKAFQDADNEVQGLREVKKIFGWKHRKPVNMKMLYWDYISLISGGCDFETMTLHSPLSKKEAIELIRQKYEFASYDAAFKQVQRAIRQQKDKFGGGGFKGLLPGNWPERSE